MKNLQQLMTALFLFLGSVAFAQPSGGDCDCPDPAPGDEVCVLDPSGMTLLFPSACFAECLGFEITDCGELPGGGGDPWGCDCEEPNQDAWVCAQDEAGNILEFPSFCIAECMGFTVVDCGNIPDGGGNPMDCDCPEPTPGDEVCVLDPSGMTLLFPSACFAECLGFEITDCGELPGGGGDPWGCDCEEPNQDAWVCAQDEAGNILEFPSACIAECMGFTVVDCGNIPDGGGNPMDCDCPEPTPGDEVCVLDPSGMTLLFPSACFAECLGFEITDCGELPGGGGDPWGCDCEEPNFDTWVCAQDEAGNILEFPSACIAECMGFAVVDCENFPGGGDPGDCGCGDPSPDQFVCVEVDGVVIPFPSACLAECFGFAVVDGDCFDFEIPGDLFGTWGIEAALNGDNDPFGGVIDELEVYPNPAYEMVNLNITAHGDGLTSVKVFNITGQMVAEQVVALTGGTQRIQIPVDHLPAGSYVIGITDGSGKQVTQHLVKTN